MNGIISFLSVVKSNLSRSSQLIQGYDIYVPFNSIHPLPITMLNALREWLAIKQCYLASLAFTIIFHGVIRAKEICKLRLSDIHFPNNGRLSVFNRTQVIFVDCRSKTGKSNFSRAGMNFSFANYSASPNPIHKILHPYYLSFIPRLHELSNTHFAFSTYMKSVKRCTLSVMGAQHMSA